MSLRDELPNYRKVKSCPNCFHCYDMGVDEECLECGYIEGDVEHDAICDLYEV
jgi:hypothetical protein